MGSSASGYTRVLDRRVWRVVREARRRPDVFRRNMPKDGISGGRRRALERQAVAERFRSMGVEFVA